MFEIVLAELHSASPNSICFEFGRISKASFVQPGGLVVFTGRG